MYFAKNPIEIVLYACTNPLFTVNFVKTLTSYIKANV